MIYPNPVQDYLVVSRINPEEYDRLLVFNLQGAQLQQHYIRSNTMRVDITGFTDAVYLLVLRSSLTGREKTMKFVVRK
jgi:hypothetical protein